PWRSDKRLPRDRQLRPLLGMWHMEADAPYCVAVGVARVRLIADPGSSPEIARDHQAEARIDRHLLLGRALPERKGGYRAGKDRKHREPEGAVARQRVVARHMSDQASGDSEPGQDGTERRYRREQEAGGSLHTLSDRQEPRHDGGPPSFPTAWRSEATPQLSATGELVAKVPLRADRWKCQAHSGRSIKRTRAAVLRLSPSAKKPLRPSRRMKGTTISTTLQNPEIQTLLEASEEEIETADDRPFEAEALRAS